ncbi:MAG: hypothetical protein ACRENE_22945 [Polyangiaceae bacterium]
MSPRAARTFGAAHLVTAALVGFGVFGCLPGRWAPVDSVAAVVALLDAAAGVGLLRGASWAERVARAASGVSLAVGLLLVTGLAVTASWLSGVYGPVGAGGAVILALVAALALPYLVAVPCVELVWLARGDDPAGRGSGEG